ncbi:MAG: hypothetical protein KM310_11520, partial [Clostridiales bacterium]|nr:hypothetical protein [Clostridiales bacterium]
TILEMALSLFALEGDRLYLVASYVGWEDPKGPVPREAYRINRLHHRHLRGRHIDWEVVKRFFELADVAVGHNVRRFDARFLSPVIPFASWLDTLSFPWRNHLAVPDRRLETLLRHLGLPAEGAHAALYDTLALAAALQMVEGGIGWLKGSFEKKREEIRQALKVFRQDLLQRYPTEGPLELEVVAGDLELKVRLTRGKQVRWYGEDGRPLTREMLEDRLWEVYLARRHRMDRPLLEVSWRE